MREQKVYFGTSRRLVEKIDSLDEKWVVEFWLIKYYFLGIEIFIQKKEVVRRLHEDPENVKAFH